VASIGVVSRSSIITVPIRRSPCSRVRLDGDNLAGNDARQEGTGR
jgi:hypothetical protein